jgi:hypothetical protein
MTRPLHNLGRGHASCAEHRRRPRPTPNRAILLVQSACRSRGRRDKRARPGLARSPRGLPGPSVPTVATLTKMRIVRASWQKGNTPATARLWLPLKCLLSRGLQAGNCLRVSVNIHAGKPRLPQGRYRLRWRHRRPHKPRGRHGRHTLHARYRRHGRHRRYAIADMCLNRTEGGTALGGGPPAAPSYGREDSRWVTSSAIVTRSSAL